MVPGIALASERERTVCGAIKERAYFMLWSSQAPGRNPAEAAQHPLVEEASFTTGDNRTLRGYRYRAHNEQLQPIDTQAYLLIAMGNAMVSDQMVPYLEPFARAGINAYVFDYRGYADSDGRRRIQAMVKDYEEIIKGFSDTYSEAYLYGTSLGGLVMLNAVSDQAPFTRAVIDSSPSRLSDFGCPERLDPVNHIHTENADRLLVITGAQDRVLNEAMTAPLRRKAEQQGAATYHGDEFDHPFMDSVNAHAKRQALVKSFLLEGIVKSQ